VSLTIGTAVDAPEFVVVRQDYAIAVPLIEEAICESTV